MIRRSAWCLLCGFVVLGCGTPAVEAPVDAGRPSLGVVDAGLPDAGASDAGASSLELIDTGIISRQFGSSFQAEPSIASSGDQRRVATWFEYSSGVGRYQVMFAISDDRGRSFSVPAHVDTPVGWWARSPVAVTGQGGVWVIWPAIELDNGARRDVRMLGAWLPDGSSTLEPVVVFDDESQQPRVGPSATTLTTGTLLVGYLEGVDAVVARRSPAGAVTRSALSTTGIPSLCASGARAYAVVLGTQGVVLSWSEDQGNTWPATQTTVLSVGRRVIGQPRCAASGDTVWVLLGEGDAPQPGAQGLMSSVRLARSDDGGRQFAPAIEVKPAAVALAATPNVSAAGDDAFVAFYSGQSNPDSMGSVQLVRVRREGAGPPVTVRGSLYFSSARMAPTWLGDSLGIDARGTRVDIAYADNLESASHVGVWSANGAALPP